MFLKEPVKKMAIVLLKREREKISVRAEPGLFKETTPFCAALKARTRSIQSFFFFLSSTNADQVPESLLCALYCWKHWLELTGRELWFQHQNGQLELSS